MTRPRNKPWEEIAQRQKDAYRHAENASRFASSYGVYTTTSWGEYYPDEGIPFAAPFLYIPNVSYGSFFANEDDAEEVRATRFPRCGGTVVKWEKSAGGLYTGAHIIVWVEDRSPKMAPTVPDPDVNYEITHCFTFTGVATKDLPSATKGSGNGVLY